MKKHILNIATLLLLFTLTTACSEMTLTSGLQPVPACENLDTSPENINEIWKDEIGIIREITLWIPIPQEEDTITRKTNELIETRLWVILPKNQPDKILWPCNLPEAQMIMNREVAFCAQLLSEHPESPNVEGVIPINILEITDGETGPVSEMDDC